MTLLELLAPAKDLACGIAAVDHGADAVYIGASRFGARSSAGNSIDDIRRLCEYAHPYGVKVYVTVNTIIYDDELEDTRLLLKQLQSVGIDAVLVQDMAVLSMLKEILQETDRPRKIAMHASTQTDNRTSEKVRWLNGLGFTRVVLARELSVKEIAQIHHDVPNVELEVFVHGALCVSYSGLCYASQHCFHRSANRGECAQFCRMSFSLVDSNDRVVERDRHLLSLKDLNQSEHLLELIEAGATSFKIEGRLKDINYVKNVTAAYSICLNEIIRRFPDKYCRSSLGHCQYTFSPDLRKTFNRDYTTYFLHGRQPDVASYDTPKAIGEYVGKVKEVRGDSFNVASVAVFSNGDGFCFFNADRKLEGFRANRVLGNRIWPYRMPQHLKPGIRLYRNNDQEFERLLARPSADRKIPLCLTLRSVPEGFSLKAVSVHGELQALAPCISVEIIYPTQHTDAQKPPCENIIRQLSKLGDTIYVCQTIDVPEDFNYFIPNSVLSEMRRSLIKRLLVADIVRPSHDINMEINSTNIELPNYKYPYLYNIANHIASEFYGVKDLSAYEKQKGEGPIMQCRYCIRHALGYCVKHGGEKSLWQEPLYLVLGDGRRFRLEFDCKNCQMNVYA